MLTAQHHFLSLAEPGQVGKMMMLLTDGQDDLQFLQTLTELSLPKISFHNFRIFFALFLFFTHRGQNSSNTTMHIYCYYFL
jgi:hypothetical protein